MVECLHVRSHPLAEQLGRALRWGNEEDRAIAHAGRTALQPTALVHEAWMPMEKGAPEEWSNRAGSSMVSPPGNHRLTVSVLPVFTVRDPFTERELLIVLSAVTTTSIET